MIFEEALCELRKGKKIRHPNMPKDEYLMGCYVRIDPMFDPNGVYLLERPVNMSIVKMIGDCQHRDMRPTFEECVNPCKHGSIPQICIFLLMCDEWEVIDA